MWKLVSQSTHTALWNQEEKAKEKQKKKRRKRNVSEAVTKMRSISVPAGEDRMIWWRHNTHDNSFQQI